MEKCPQCPGQEDVVGRQARWSCHWSVFIAKVKDRCVRQLTSGECLIVSLIRRMISENHACKSVVLLIWDLSGINVCVLLLRADVGVCMYAIVFVCMSMAPMLEQSHLLIRNYEREVIINYSIRCCGLANIWISDGVVEVHSALSNSAQLDSGLRCCVAQWRLNCNTCITFSAFGLWMFFLSAAYLGFSHPSFSCRIPHMLNGR